MVNIERPLARRPAWTLILPKGHWQFVLQECSEPSKPPAAGRATLDDLGADAAAAKSKRPSLSNTCRLRRGASQRKGRTGRAIDAPPQRRAQRVFEIIRERKSMTKRQHERIGPVGLI